MLNQNKEKVKIEKLKKEVTVLNKEQRKLAENLSALRSIISEKNRGPDVDKILNLVIENIKLQKEIKDELKEHALIYKINNLISSTLDLEKVLIKIVKLIRKYFNYLICDVLLLDEQKENLHIAASDGYLAESRRNIWIKLGKGVTGKVAATGKPLLVTDVTKFERYICSVKEVRSEVAVPLKVKNELIGVFNVESEKLNAFDKRDLRLLSILSVPVAIAIQNARLHQQIKNLAITDELTGLYNFRCLQDRLKEEVKRAQRYERPLALIMADIDYFKEYNDTFGHPEGNEVLKILANILKANVREIDIVGRYGGEEFIIILPEADKEEAREIAERIRLKTEGYKFINNKDHPDKTKLTLSLGVTSCFQEPITPESLIYKVDQALYQAKRKGRNRVEVI